MVPGPRPAIALRRCGRRRHPGATLGAVRAARAPTAALLLMLLGCGAAPDGAADAGSGGADAGLLGVLEVGTGVVAFEDLDPVVPTPMTPGPQAGGRYEGFHIWVSLRLTDVDPEALATYAVRLRGTDGVVAAEVLRDAARAPFELDAKGRWVLSGLAPRLADCCTLSGRKFLAEAEVMDAAGRALITRAEGVAGACPACP